MNSHESTQPAGGDDAIQRFAQEYLRNPDPARVQELLRENSRACDQLADAILDAPLGTSGGASSSGDASSSELSSPEAEDEFIGSYRLVKPLGRGGQAVVYLAEDTKLRRRVALKVLLGRDLFSSRDAFERFEREARTASKLSHPNICPVYDAGEDKGVAFIAMRYVEGCSMRELLQRSESDRPFEIDWSTVTTELPRDTTTDVDRTLLFFERAARALHEAHEAGVVHRDVKAANIMVTEDGSPMLLDFGLARDEEAGDPSLTKSGDLFGTPAYMSPEQIQQPGAPDRRTDVYSLGITLYEALVGELPYKGATFVELQQQILDGRLPAVTRRRPGLPRELDAVVRTAAEPDRDRRYRNAEEFAEDLRRVRRREPIHASPPGIALRVRRWAQRNPVLAAVVCVLAVSALVASTQWLRAERHNSNFRRLQDVTLAVDYLAAAEQELWPPSPGRVPAMQRWIENVRELVSRAPAHEATLAELRSRAPRTERSGVSADSRLSDGMRDRIRNIQGAYRTRLESAKDEGRRRRYTAVLEAADRTLAQSPPTVESLKLGTPALESALDRFLFDAIRGMVDDVARLESLVPEIERRVRFAYDVAASSNKSVDRWKEVRAEVLADPRMKGLELSAQAGLVPLGKDPLSGLQEFALVGSGAIPERDPDTKRLSLTDDMALVFVLVPPCEASASPVESRIDAFFLGKFEVTRHQWAALHPAEQLTRFPDGKQTHQADFSVEIDITPRHPMDNVSWNLASRLARHYGLTLPTEAQWQYAAFAGASMSEWEQALPRGANLFDKTAADAGATWNGAKSEEWSDGHVLHAPVGTFDPNAFGMHDMFGNHWEWCRDHQVPRESVRATPGTGELIALDGETNKRLLRGGSYYFPADPFARSARPGEGPDTASDNVGARLARAIEPPPSGR